MHFWKHWYIIEFSVPFCPITPRSCRYRRRTAETCGDNDVSRTRFARHGELRIAYKLRGIMHWRRPRLVLIQGLGFDRFGWEPVLPELQRHFRLVLVDNRGSGRSDLPSGSFGVADMASDVIAVLDDAGVRRAHIMGVSLGGMMAQELAVDHPDRVDALVLVSTTPGWPFAYPMPAVSVGLIAAAGITTREVALRRHTENALSACPGRRRPEIVDRLVELQRSRPADPRARSARAAAGARYAGRLRQSLAGPGRFRRHRRIVPAGCPRRTDPARPGREPTEGATSGRAHPHSGAGRHQVY